MAFNPSVQVLVNTLVDGFPTTQLPSSKYTPSNIKSDVVLVNSNFGKKIAYQEDFKYKPIRVLPGKLRNKNYKGTKPRSIITKEQLLETIKNKYAFLLKKKSDESGYIIDLTFLTKIKMRKRYQSLGCVIELNKDLTDVSIHDTTIKSLTPEQLYQLAMVALALYNVVKILVGSIYNSITSNITFATRIVNISNAVYEAIHSTANQTGAIITAIHSIGGSIDSDKITSTIQHVQDTAGKFNQGIQTVFKREIHTPLNTTQETMYPFQHGTPQFLDRIDKLLLSPKGLLYQITGIKYKYILQSIQSGVQHELPFGTQDAVTDALPVKQLGLTYWNNIKIFINDCIDKKLIIIEEAKEFIKHFELPTEWSIPDTLTYILWQHFFNHNLTVHSSLSTWKSIGSYITKKGETSHEGTHHAIEAFEHFLSLQSTKLVSCSDVVSAPSLSRKFISLKQEVSKDTRYKELQFLNPEHVSISLV